MSSSPASAAHRDDHRLACQRDPEQWFDCSDRTHALAGCLGCPARRRCAREALSVAPTLGMWAGIWINGNFADVAHYLHAIAETRPPSPTPARRHHPAAMADAGRQSVAAMITARSSGHCEIMAPDCLLTLDGIASRIPRRLWFELRDPAAGYAVCRRCRSVVSQMEGRLARRLGYLVDAHHDPTSVPFYWRQKGWMLLVSTGAVHPAPHLIRPA